MLPEYFEFTVPTKIIYGNNLISNIGESIKHFGDCKAILVTDRILGQIGLAKKVRDGFKGTNIEITCTYDNVPPNSTIKTVAECAEMAKQNKCNMIIALGGGSVIDTAKVSNIMMKKGGKIEDHMGAYLLGQEELFPTIFIPTTAGTGSEVTKVAVIADPDNNVKLPFSETQFLPDLAVLDPEMTASMPPKLTAMTGMDALTHAIEAYVDKEWSPASDALALHVIKMITNNILVACAHPRDLQARGAMAIASCLAGIAFSHSMVGMVHGISHALGGVYHIPHGLANALVLPEVMDYNLESQLDRYADIAEAMGISFPQPVTVGQSMLENYNVPFPRSLVLNSSGARKVASAGVQALGNLDGVDRWFRRQAARAGVERVRTLNRQLSHLTGMPLNLREAGITDGLAKLDLLADTAMEDGSMLYNPREPERSAVVSIVRKVYYTAVTPLSVSEAELRPSKAKGVAKKTIKDVFKNTEMVYDVLGEFYEVLKNDPNIGKPLADSKICVQFKYDNPAATITIDARGDEAEIFLGDEFRGDPEVTMMMSADMAHYFWHGKVNLVSALTRRQVLAKGNVPKTLKLLPILKPAFELYPKFLAEKGMADTIVS